MKKWTDADPDEEQFAEDLKTAFPDAGACPPPELIQAVRDALRRCPPQAG